MNNFSNDLCELKNTAEIVKSVLSEGMISDINLRMLVKVIYIHQNDDKSLDIRVVMNGAFSISHTTQNGIEESA